MRPVALATLALLATLPAHADGPRARPDIDVIVPVEPTEHERLHYFGRRDHHLVPGTVTINGAAYVCDVDAKRFTDRDAFVAHLVRTHRVPAARIPDRLLVRDGRVHFIGN